MRKDIQLFGLGFHSKSPNVTSNKLQNAYYEFQKFPDRTKVGIFGTPGLFLLTDAGASPWRGLHSMLSTGLMYGVNKDGFFDVNNAGIRTSRGTIGTSSGRVDICDDGTRVVVVDGSEIYTYDTSTPSTPIAAVADVDRPLSPNTCCFQGGRILTDENGTGQFKGSDILAPTSWNSLSFATAESKPDPLVRIVEYLGTVVLFGTYSTEFWQNVGGSGFPYARILSPTMEYGLAARWSVARFMGSYGFLAQNREGQVIVAMLEGYGAKRISNFELENEINKYQSKADASGYGYMLGGHPMYQLNFSNEGKSWLYDGSTDYWSELKTGNKRHRGELAVDFLNQTIVADYENGKLYRLDHEVFSDNGEEIITQLTGNHIVLDGMTFSVDWLEVQGETGVGLSTGNGSDPQIALQLSKDGGHSFNTEQFRSWGKSGEYNKRAVWRSQGIGTDIVPRLTISSPVKKVFTTGVMGLTKGLS